MGECSLPHERSEWLETSIYQNRDITEHCAELKDWNEELEKFIYKYNHYRPHNSLENKDKPMEAYLQSVACRSSAV